MSEYQYYEFRAIDRSLTDRQMRELRAISTRAVISRTSFSNHYEYGDLKANPRDLLVRYFDASLIFANWLFLEVAFRYPRGAVDARALRRYAAGHTIGVRSTGPDVVVSISVESDGGSFDSTDDGTSWLSSLASLGPNEHLALLARVARGDASVGAEIMRRYRRHAGPRSSGLPLRTAGALRERAEAMAEARHHVARQREVRACARHERQEQVARDRYLTGLAKREREAWQRVDALIGTKRPRDYDAAVTLLSDLRDMSGQNGRAGQFAQRTSELRQTHATKPSLLARLKAAGF